LDGLQCNVWLSQCDREPACGVPTGIVAGKLLRQLITFGRSLVQFPFAHKPQNPLLGLLRRIIGALIHDVRHRIQKNRAEARFFLFL
ncbi:MAG: hypothetical protein OEQ14_19360, partial [Gammaproteobacteria bacterium]|nr:hypothetical protein [Gammaproteobacteria bacterium]